MHPADLTPVEIADLFDAAYRQDLGLSDDGPDLVIRADLADYLGCHEEARAAAWALLRQEVTDPDAAEYWLDIEFIQPFPQDQAEA